MKYLYKLIILLAIFIANHATAQDKIAFNIDNSNIALQGYSPVSYLELGIAQKGLKEFKSKYKKMDYYFTSASQKKSFDKNPRIYLPQYGGYCAFGVYAGAKFRPDPNKFIVKDGKYFLYLYNIEVDAQQLWIDKKDHDKLVNTADNNWKKLSITYN